VPYQCISVDADESCFSKNPAVAVCEISSKKAVAALDGEKELEENQVIIGADTIVVCDDKILGKPENATHAKQMLKMLSGRTHQVYTGITLLYKKDGRAVQKAFSECTDVEFEKLTDSEIDEYIAVDEYKDKAGSYAIQGVFSAHIKGIKGDYNNVVGFPVARLYKELKTIFGEDFRNDI
jgi:MAF protein